MCITEEKLLDRYGQGNPHERFMLIYKNYEVFLKLIESYETGLFNRILYEREYNLRAKNAEDIVKVRFRYWNNFRIYQDDSTEEGQWAFEILPDGTIKYYSYPSSGRRVLDKMKVRLWKRRNLT